jgi:hypothetical protein
MSKVTPPQARTTLRQNNAGASFVSPQLAPAAMPPVTAKTVMDQIRALPDSPFLQNTQALAIANMLREKRDLFTGAVGDQYTGASSAKKKKWKNTEYDIRLRAEIKAAKILVSSLMLELMPYQAKLTNDQPKQAIVAAIIKFVYREDAQNKASPTSTEVVPPNRALTASTRRGRWR